jgi:hypothetical protein
MYMELLVLLALVAANGRGRDCRRDWHVWYGTERQGSNCAFRLHRGSAPTGIWGASRGYLA